MAELDRGQVQGPQIVTIQDDPRYQYYIGQIALNPDRVLRQEGRGLGVELYMRAEEDAHLASVLQQRYLATIEREWQILPASDAPRDQEIADFVRRVLLASNFDVGRGHLLRAIHRGYSVCELDWGLDVTGAIALRQWWPRAPYRFVFGIEGELRVLTRIQRLHGEEVPPAKFVVHTVGDEVGTRYGKGLGQVTYWLTWFKRELLKFWLIYADKHGMPTPVIKYDPLMPNVDEYVSKLQDAISELHSETGLLIPGLDIDVSILESNRQGASGLYEGFAAYLDSSISKAVLTQTLTTQEQGTGSLALGDVHASGLKRVTKSDSDALAETLNGPTGPIHTLVDLNYPSVQEYPQYAVNWDEDDNLNARAERDQRLGSLGVVFTQRYITEHYGIPAPEAGDVVLTPQGRTAGNEPPMSFAEADRALARRVAREQAQRQMLEDLASPFVGRAGADFARQVRMWVSQRSTLDNVGAQLGYLETALDLDLLGNTLYATMLPGRLLGLAQVALDNGPAAFAAVEPLPSIVVEPEEALEWFRDKVPLSADAYRALADEVKSLAFGIAGVQNVQIVALIQAALEQALAEGSTFSVFLDRIDALFDAQAPGTTPGRAHLENVFRTNLQSAYQAGRLEGQRQAAGRRPYWQYNAIDDDRVRESHLAQDGKVYRYDHPFWDRWYPPNGYQCRCTVTTLSEDELGEFGLQVSQADAPEAPDQGFAGYPREV